MIKLFSGIIIHLNDLMTVFAFVLSLFQCYKKGKEPFLKLLPPYLFLSALQDFSQYISLTFFAIASNLFPLFELAIFTMLFTHLLNSKTVRIFSWILFLVLVVDFGIVSIANHSITAINLGNLYLLESLFLLFPSVLYIRQLFISRSNIIFWSDPKFWASTGIFILAGGSLPLSFVLWKYQFHIGEIQFPYLTSIFAILYLILNIFFIKAYTCRIKNIAY